MEIVLLATFFGVITNLDATHCDKELNYHDNYGYGIDISCDGLSVKNQNALQEISVSNEISLRISNSNLSGVTQSLFQHVRRIRYLQIANSTFLFDSHQTLFSKLTKLQHLTVENTKFSFHADVFRGLDNLEELVLRKTSLGLVVNGTFSGLRNLETLKLSHNNFKNVFDVPFCDLSSMKHLDLDHNKITSIGHETFACRETETGPAFKLNGRDPDAKYHSSKVDYLRSTSDLIELNLSHNLIEKIDLFDWAPSLKYINLSNNRLRSLGATLFLVLRDLEKLNLENNSLLKVGPKIFSMTKVLRNVNFSNNQISQLWLDDLPSLEELDLSRNQITSETLSQIKNLPKLQTLLLNENLIRPMPNKIFVSFPSLETLDLSGNKLRLESHSLRYLSNLKQLVIRNCSIETLPSSVFANLTNLEYLDISSNKIEIINFLSHLSNLQVLNMSHNMITNISYELLKPLRNLQVLDISGNKLEHFQINFISLLPSLRVINIKANLLSCRTLTGFVKFLKRKNISYTMNEELENHRQSVDGTRCEAAPETATENRTTGEFRSSTTFGIFIFLVLSCVCISFASYKYFLYTKRRRYVMDELELL